MIRAIRVRLYPTPDHKKYLAGLFGAVRFCFNKALYLILQRAIADAGWGEFMRQCEYKAKHEGRIFAKIGTFYPSSKTCSACGHKLKDLSLATRSWTCPYCGAHHDRDLNASLNIKQEGIRMLKAAGMTVLRS